MSLCSLGLSCELIHCEHEKQLRKEQCHLCEIKLQIIALTDMYKSLSIQVASQHEFKLKQIESEIKELKRFQDITHEQYQYIIKNKKYCHECGKKNE
jgi:hypothetical protein